MNTGMEEMQMIEREWTFTDCRVAKYSWGFRVWACGGHCDVVPGNGDDMDACEAALDSGESPIASGWEDGAGHDVAAECGNAKGREVELQ